MNDPWKNVNDCFTSGKVDLRFSVSPQLWDVKQGCAHASPVACAVQTDDRCSALGLENLTPQSVLWGDLSVCCSSPCPSQVGSSLSCRFPAAQLQEPPAGVPQKDTRCL